MCDHCGAVICTIFDRMIAREIAFLQAIAHLSESRRPTYYSLEIGTTGRHDTDKLSDLVAQAKDIGLSPNEMEQELCRRTKMLEPVRGWIAGRFVPNGLARKIILTNVEQILTERGARPERSAREIQPLAA